MEERDANVYSKILKEGREGVWALHGTGREQEHGSWGHRSGIETDFSKKNLLLKRDKDST